MCVVVNLLEPLAQQESGISSLVYFVAMLIGDALGFISFARGCSTIGSRLSGSGCVLTSAWWVGLSRVSVLVVQAFGAVRLSVPHGCVAAAATQC